VAHALERREPLVVITGDIGTGKTLLCRTVLQRLPFKTFLSVIHDPLLEADDLIKELLKDFGVIAKDPARFGGATRHQLVETLHAFLTSLAPIQAHAVVMIDEAQHLRPDVLEQIRLLSNIDDTKGTILQIILVGQTDLEPLLARPELRQLQQRVSRRFALEPLNTEEVQQYIKHRLALAWRNTAPRDTDIFTPDAIRAIAQISNGVPRVVNLLCDRSLEQAFVATQLTIDASMIHAAARALGIKSAATSRLPEAVSPWSPAPDTVADIVQRADEAATPASFGDLPRTGRQSPPSTRMLMLAGLAVVLAAAGFFGMRWALAPAAGAPTQATPPPAARPAATQPAGVTPAGADAPPKEAAAPAAKPADTSAAPAGAAAASSFDIVVASFRTEARASSVAEQVTALGVPVRRRESNGWQQVIAGPFATRTAAEEAQQRIHAAGLTGTEIAPVVPRVQ